MQSSQAPSRSGYFPALDGLRAVAILAVITHHYAADIWDVGIFWWGWAGVDLFFVISGFLITGILYDTLTHKHYFRNFYIRRTLRIFPLYYAVWLGLLLVSLVCHTKWNRYIFYDAIYLLNWFSTSSALKQHAESLVLMFKFGRHMPSVDLAHLWSLAIEEQFYLVWPFVLWLVRKRTSLMTLCGLCILGTPFFRLYLYIHSTPAQIAAESIVGATYTRFDTLLVGAWFALWLRSQKAPSVAKVRQISHWLIGFSLPCFVLSVLTIAQHWPMTTPNNPIVCTYGFTLIALISAGLILGCLDPTSLIARVLSQRPLIHIGRISYGMYIFHYLLIVEIVHYERKLQQKYHLDILGFLAAFAMTYLTARLSYKWIEMPFLKLKDRYTAKDHGHAPVTLPALT